ncbi:MAG: replication initiation protein [Hyphomicrobium sp.]|nr:replication initiation protein [Hyphomicrobium sp.]
MNQHVSTFLPQFQEPQPVNRKKGSLLATEIKTTGQFLDPNHMGKIIKPRELVDIVELSPLSRNELVLYNQLLGHAWNNITTQPVHKVLKAALRGSHESNDRIDESLDELMRAMVKVRASDPDTGEMATFRVHLLGTNKTEDRKDGYFYYTFPPDLLVILSQSKVWATLASHIMYTLRSKYSIRLYEMIERRISLIKQSEEFTVDEMRSMLGVPPGKLERYADFNKYCLKLALAEVNQLCDFTVDAMPIKKGHTVEKLFVTWMKKSHIDCLGYREFVSGIGGNKFGLQVLYLGVLRTSCLLQLARQPGLAKFGGCLLIILRLRKLVRE